MARQNHWPDQDEALRQVCQQLEAVIPEADGLAVAFCDQETGALDVRLVKGGQLLEPMRVSPAGCDGPEVSLIRQGKALLMAGDNVPSLLARRAVRAWAGAPILREGEIVGMITAWASAPNVFGQRELALLRMAASLLAFALENAALQRDLATLDSARIEFVSIVSHELRTPMTAIKGYVEMLLSGMTGDLTDVQRRFLGVIKVNADRLGKLINDMLEFSRLESRRVRLQGEPVPLGPVIQEVISTLQGEMAVKRLDFAAEVPPNLPPAWGDRERLVQIVANLLSNAIKYTPEGGRIRIRATALPTQMQVDVADTGIGIAAEDHPKVFTRFFRADHDLVREQTGTGLGLSIAKGLVELHGGRIWFESAPGRGSTFSFTIPLVGQEREAGNGPSHG